ncbi:hypothetical protein LJR001_000829 [Achromobacter mucicolens]|nr:hypothetical protein [Achromobacter animicus]MDH0684820.1 hypothetical protein [Achromobacter animicus]
MEYFTLQGKSEMLVAMCADVAGDKPVACVPNGCGARVQCTDLATAAWHSISSGNGRLLSRKAVRQMIKRHSTHYRPALHQRPDLQMELELVGAVHRPIDDESATRVSHRMSPPQLFLVLDAASLPIWPRTTAADIRTVNIEFP